MGQPERYGKDNTLQISGKTNPPFFKTILLIKYKLDADDTDDTDISFIHP